MSSLSKSEYRFSVSQLRFPKETVNLYTVYLGNQSSIVEKEQDAVKRESGQELQWAKECLRDDAEVGRVPN